jgi:hypothetical protein
MEFERITTNPRQMGASHAYAGCEFLLRLSSPWLPKSRLRSRFSRFTPISKLRISATPCSTQPKRSENAPWPATTVYALVAIPAVISALALAILGIVRRRSARR